MSEPTRLRTVRRPQAAEIGHGQPSQWWALWGDEETPELQWPGSNTVYDRMQRQDPQVLSALAAVQLPVQQATWRLDPADASDEVTTFVAENLGLPIKGKSEAPPRATRERDRFSWTQHVEWALECTVFGHMFFEQVYRFDAATGRFHLRKLAPRWPKTIQEIKTARDGGLEAIVQRPWIAPGVVSTSDKEPITIPVQSLVAYVYKRRGTWLGQSLLRSAYKHWLLKDRSLRRWDERDERNSMGVPHYTAGEEEDTLEHGRALATSYRSGAASGGAGPFGSRMELLGVQGMLPDIEAAARYHDEAITKSVLAHFLNLGQQTGTGSYALGASFIDFFIMSLQSLAQLIADTATQHVVEDLVDVNFGENEPAPVITFDPIGQNAGAVVQALQMLIASGAIFPDPALDAFVRQLVGLPPKAPLPNATTPAGAAGPPVPERPATGPEADNAAPTPAGAD
jgi:hypothetical protein